MSIKCNICNRSTSEEDYTYARICGACYERILPGRWQTARCGHCGYWTIAISGDNYQYSFCRKYSDVTDSVTLACPEFTPRAEVPNE